MKSHRKFFATNAPDPPHWTLNLCFCAFRSVWVHLSMFRHYTKLGAKRVELVQSMHKFVPLSRIGIFHNERTQSTPLDSKLMFWSIFVVLGAFGNVSLLHETRCKIGWSGAINGQVCAMKSHHKFFTTNAPDPPHWTLNSWFGAFHSVWVHFGLFRYCTKVDAMRAEMVELMHKFVPWSCVRIFQNEHTRSTQLNPKLMFWCVS